MIVAETQIFAVGRFTVQQRPRFDNPAFAVYIVYLGARLVGKQFSRPSLSDANWLLRTHGTYATPEQNAPFTTYRSRQAKNLATARRRPSERFP